jgi:type II secretory pathway pseudopilin PulG
MVALLVAMALMAVMMSVALPVWRQAAQREKEAELVWRGQQYDRALQLFRRKTSTPGPPNLDILIQQKYLRKKYKDPITGDDFELKPVGAMGPGSRTPGMPNRPGARRSSGRSGTQPSGSGAQPAAGSGTQSAAGSPPVGGARSGAPPSPEMESEGNDSGNSPSSFGTRSAGAAGQREAGMSPGRGFGQLIGGVRSKSKARSIRELNGKTRYNEWEFVYVPYNPNPQPPGTGARPGGRQQPGTGATKSTSPGATPSKTPPLQ